MSHRLVYVLLGGPTLLLDLGSELKEQIESGEDQNLVDTRPMHATRNSVLTLLSECRNGPANSSDTDRYSEKSRLVGVKISASEIHEPS